MEKFCAICPFCARSIIVTRNLSGGYACTHCGQALGLQYLKDNGLIINIEQANYEYALAFEYFNNTDFREAGEHFKKVLEHDRNNYLSDYYMRLCEIYQNEHTESYNVAKMAIEAVKSSVEKMNLSFSKVSDKLEFLTAIANQIFILLLNHFNYIYGKYEQTEKWADLRTNCLNMITYIKELMLIDKEVLMTFDENISKSLVRICDLAVTACQKVVQPHVVDNKKLDVASDEQYLAARTFSNDLCYYAVSLDPKFNAAAYKPDFTANLLFNESVITRVEQYDALNKSNRKKYLSRPGEELSAVLSGCELASQYSYHNCFKGIYRLKADQARLALINDASSFCFELLIPRITITEDKKLSIEVPKYKEALKTAALLNEFLSDLSDNNKRTVIDAVNRFYNTLNEMTSLYFSFVYNVHSKHTNKLKQFKNSDYKYYKNFLYKITCCCALALKDIVLFDQHKMPPRLKLLKLGKQASEEFFLLCDYRIDEIEKSVQYADILDIYNLLDASIAYFSEKQ